MANSERSKQKTLLIYDYFLRFVNDFDERSGVSVPELIRYLKTVTGEEFERKSIYADFKKLNQFVSLLGLTEEGEDWIYPSGGKKYSRRELKYELSLDEARLIVDAIRTTPFIETGLCEKIEKMYPSYFGGGYKALIPHDHVISQRTKFLLNSIRTCIDEKTVFSFRYGYKFAGAIKGASIKNTSPLALDWIGGHYYLIAVDNDVYEETKDRETSIRRYRIDRIDRRFHQMKEDLRYRGFKDDKDKILDRYLQGSVDAFGAQETRYITVTLKCPDEKTLLRAYAAFEDDVRIKGIVSDKPENGMIAFSFEAGLVPTLFTLLFRFYTFDGLTVEIDDPDVRKQFREYLKRALATV